MKRIVSVFLAAVLSVPNIAFAGQPEKEKTEMPFSVNANCMTIYNNEKIIDNLKIRIEESVANAFTENTVLEFDVKNMDFYCDEAVLNEEVAGDIQVKDGNLRIFINHSDPEKMEKILVSDLILKADRTLPVGVYSLYLKTAEQEKAAVVSDFIEVVKKHIYVDLKLELKLGEQKIWKNGIEHPLLVPAYLSEAGYVMLPIREIAEAFPGTSVWWDNKAKQAYICSYTPYAIITANQEMMMFKANEVPMKNPAEVKDGRTFVSIRDICRICDIPEEMIEWDSDTQMVTIHARILSSEDVPVDPKEEYDAEQAQKAKERVTAKRDELGLNILGVDMKYNALYVASEYWTEEKKQAVREVADFDKIIFDTVVWID